MWHHLVGARLDDVLGATCACQARRTYVYLTELVCTLCSRVVATVVAGQLNAPIWVPQQLRCRHCGGQPLAGETVRQVVYPSVPFEQPRRGRPRAGWWSNGGSIGVPRERLPD